MNDRNASFVGQKCMDDVVVSVRYVIKPAAKCTFHLSIKVTCSSVWVYCISSLLPESCIYTTVLELQVRMKFGVVTKVLVITQVSSGLKISHILIFSKYKYP